MNARFVPAVADLPRRLAPTSLAPTAAMVASFSGYPVPHPVPTPSPAPLPPGPDPILPPLPDPIPPAGPA